MLIDFIKMHAQGNDFVILDHPEAAILQADLGELALAVCDLKFGFGADGLVIYTDSDTAAARMIIYNSDGTRAAMCGSALRCLTYLYASKFKVNQFEIETDNGIKTCRLDHDDVTTVNLGKPVIIEAEMAVGDFVGSLVDVGNLHYVVYTQNLADAPHMRHGDFLEHHPAFPQTVNVHFAKLINRFSIQLAIWENGVGPTLACGTGATAAVLAGIITQGLEQSVSVEMPGGKVQVSQNPETGDFELSGAVTFVGTGQYRWIV